MKDQYSVVELLKIANARLYPSITTPSYLVLRRRRLIFSKWLEGIPGDRLAVLDIGGRYQPYRPLIQHRVQRYLALDIQRTPLVERDEWEKGKNFPSRPIHLTWCLPLKFSNFFRNLVLWLLKSTGS